MKQDKQVAVHPLAQFAATLKWDDVPEAVQCKAEDLWVDWFGSVLAGQSARPVQSIARFALSQGPAQGPCEVIGQRSTTSPMMAALANAAASHVAEQDDVHNGSVFHPAAVVFPPTVAVAQSIGASGAQLMAACVAGYEVGIRVGEFLGRSHYKIFHTTGTAGTLAAAAAVGNLLGLTPAQMQHALGSAGTQAAAQRTRLLVRINAAGTAWVDDDVHTVATLVSRGLAGAVVPKAESPEYLNQLAQQTGTGCALVALIETVAGMDALPALARAAQVQRLAFGHLDFQVDAGMQCAPDEGELLPTRMALVMASRRASLPPPIDGVTVDTQDPARLHSDTARALRMGFGGKLCIHPAQLEGVHAVFAPDALTVEHAQAVVQAMEAANGGVCVVNSKMVDAPVLHLAQRTLQRHAWAMQRS
nr:aldolase/citrate lyase family protein [Comamonas kerstersii]